MYHKKVKKQLALNPVARAVARKQLEQLITTRKIQLYLMAEGDPCEEVCASVGFTLSVLAYAAELDKAVGADAPQVRVMRGAISACQQMADADRYAVVNTRALDVALDAAVELNRRLKPECITRAWNSITGLA